MRRFYDCYQYVAFLGLFPFSLYLWHDLLGDWQRVCWALSLPVLVAYVIPALGTSVTKLWAFPRCHFGNFRIYHGFVLGASVNVFGYMLYRVSPAYTGALDSAFFALLAGGCIAFVNWYYDIYAVQSGFIVVYNREAYEKKSSHEIVAAYALVYFFLFGAVWALCCAAALLVPPGGYALHSYWRCGDTGLCRYRGKGER